MVGMSDVIVKRNKRRGTQKIRPDGKGIPLVVAAVPHLAPLRSPVRNEEGKGDARMVWRGICNVMRWMNHERVRDVAIVSHTDRMTGKELTG